jgi:tetratricopeptide (TPR) repeat protein
MTRAAGLQEHEPQGMVYRRNMTTMLVALLLTAMPGEVQSEASPPTALPAPVATRPADMVVAPPDGASGTTAAPGETPGAGEQQLPEAATAAQVPAKPPVQHQELETLDLDMRLDAYEQFRTLYETSRFAEALPYAKQVVELSEQGDDPDHELPIAYNNLGATQYQLGDYAGANASYRKSLDMLEATQGISSRRLVVPLAGLGAVYAARDDYNTAAELYDRALAVSRRSDGLFNLQQIPLIKQAADSRYAIRDFSGAERQYLYALKIAEQNFGYGDARTVPPLLELGTFYEGLREFIAARMMYMRARDAALEANPGYSPEAVKALTGIARCHRLQYTIDPNTLESQQPARDEVTGETVSRVYPESRVPPPAADRTGLKAAQHALDLMRATPQPPPELMTRTLIELGDWFQATSRPAMSLPYYAEAAAILDAQVAADPLQSHPLREPRMVFYRPPLSARRGLNALSGRYVIRKTVFSFTVAEDGVPRDITVVSSDMNEDQIGLSRRAVAKAIYSPRFAAGKPVTTAGVTFTGEWYEEVSGEEPPPAPAPAPAPIETTSQPPIAAEPASTGGR